MTIWWVNPPSMDLIGSVGKILREERRQGKRLVGENTNTLSRAPLAPWSWWLTKRAGMVLVLVLVNQNGFQRPQSEGAWRWHTDPKSWNQEFEGKHLFGSLTTIWYYLISFHSLICSVNSEEFHDFDMWKRLGIKICSLYLWITLQIHCSSMFDEHQLYELFWCSRYRFSDHGFVWHSLSLLWGRLVSGDSMIGGIRRLSQIGVMNITQKKNFHRWY